MAKKQKTKQPKREYNKHAYEDMKPYLEKIVNRVLTIPEVMNETGKSQPYIYAQLKKYKDETGIRFDNRGSNFKPKSLPIVITEETKEKIAEDFVTNNTLKLEPSTDEDENYVPEVTKSQQTDKPSEEVYLPSPDTVRNVTLMINSDMENELITNSTLPTSERKSLVELTDGLWNKFILLYPEVMKMLYKVSGDLFVDVCDKQSKLSRDLEITQEKDKAFKLDPSGLKTATVIPFSQSELESIWHDFSSSKYKPIDNIKAEIEEDLGISKFDVLGVKVNKISNPVNIITNINQATGKAECWRKCWVTWGYNMMIKLKDRLLVCELDKNPTSKEYSWRVKDVLKETSMPTNSGVVEKIVEKIVEKPVEKIVEVVVEVVKEVEVEKVISSQEANPAKEERNVLILNYVANGTVIRKELEIESEEHAIALLTTMKSLS